MIELIEAKGTGFTGWLEQFNNLKKHYEAETDRAAAILAISFLDATIGEMLQRVMVADEPPARQLLKRGLRDFANRINVCYCLGLISKIVRDDMHALRDLRNHFAHHPEPTDFKNAKATEHLVKLKTTKVVADAGVEPRQVCLTTVAVCLGALDVSTRGKPHPASPDDAASVLGPEVVRKA
jgi:DNA-binding MltR family transcriptional regulator